MSSRGTMSQSGGAAARRSELQEAYSVAGELVYAGSSSTGDGSTRGTTRHSSDGYLYATDNRCFAGFSNTGDGGTCGTYLYSSSGYLYAADNRGFEGNEGDRHYEEVGGDLPLPRLFAENHRRLGVRPSAASGGEFVQTQSRWTTLSRLCGVSTLLAACSLSSLTACIAVTVCSQTRMEPRRAASGAACSDFERNDTATGHRICNRTERLLPTPLADHSTSHLNNSASQSEPAARYTWNCSAQTSLVQCHPVQIGQRHCDGTLSSFQQDGRNATTMNVQADGLYHVSVQMAGTVRKPPPTYIRASIARVKSDSSAVKFTVVYGNTGLSGGRSLATAAVQNGSYSVYSAATVPLSQGDELLAQIVCIEDPDCFLHVNSTTSYLTLERLN